MEIRITEKLKMESMLPLTTVESFRFDWRPNRHAVLELVGFINRGMEYKRSELYGSKVKLWLEKDDTEQVLFHGCIGRIEEQIVGNTTKVCLKVESGSCGLVESAVWYWAGQNKLSYSAGGRSGWRNR